MNHTQFKPGLKGILRGSLPSDIPIHVIAHILRSSYRFNVRCRTSPKYDAKRNLIGYTYGRHSARIAAHVCLSYVLVQPPILNADGSIKYSYVYMRCSRIWNRETEVETEPEE